MYDANESIDNLENFLKYGFELNYNLIDESIRWENEFFNKNYSDDYFYHQYCLNINAYYQNEDVGEGECIGEMELKLFNVGLMDFEGTNRFSVFDDINVELSELRSILESAKELKDRYKDSSYVLYIQRLLINKGIRNKGIAHRVLSQIENIIDWYLEIVPDIIYKNCGFECIKNLGSYYFYKINNI